MRLPVSSFFRSKSRKRCHIWHRPTTAHTHTHSHCRTIRLFTECNEAKILFGFPMDIDPNSPELLTSKRFAAHAAYLIQMIDTALNMLGPDIEMLTEIMADLGAKHIRYGVKAHMFPIMGRCLIEVLEECLPEGYFTPTIKEAWVETYGALSADLIEAVNKKK